MRIPNRMKVDAIAEAICEIRFESAETKEAPEIILGALSKGAFWSGYPKKRLPDADIPTSLRDQHPELRYKCSLEFKDRSSTALVKVGENVLVVSQLRPYAGWACFSEQIFSAIKHIFENFTEIAIHRIGVRYVNVLSKKEHKISSIYDLDFSLEVNGSSFDQELNINFFRKDVQGFEQTVRIASPKFVSTKSDVEMSAVVDIDIGSSGASLENLSECCDWVEKAHLLEKERFFEIFTKKQLNDLVEEWVDA